MSLATSFLFGAQRRLTNIIRWNTTPKIISESVSSHSYFVTLYSMYLSDYLKEKYLLKINIEKVMRMSILHDIEECFSGDIVASLKAADEDFKEILANVCRKVVKEVFKGCTFSEEYILLWEEYREEKTIEAKIARVSDILCQILYSFEEIKLGNEFMEPICENSLRLLKTYTDEWIRELYSEISDFVISNTTSINLEEDVLYSHELLHK